MSKDSIFIDGDFNDSYESRIRKSKMKRTKFKSERVYHVTKHEAEQINEKEWLKMLEVDYPPIAEEIKLGYKSILLEPLKCIKCESKEFQKVEVYGGELGAEEYKLACKNCKHINGHCSYGNWII